MNKQTPKLIADLFIKKCLEEGLSPFEKSKSTSFGDFGVTNRVRHIVKRWDERRLYLESMAQPAREHLAEFISKLPMISGLAIHRTEISKPARIGYRVYAPDTLQVLFEIRDQDIPEKYRVSEETKMRYAAFWASSTMSSAA